MRFSEGLNMTALTSTVTVTPVVPAQNGKCLLIKTPSTAVGSDTIDLASTKPALKTIYHVECNTATGWVVSASWSGTTITLPAAFSGAGAIAYLTVFGTD